MLDVEVAPGTKVGSFRFRVDNGYLRIIQNGGVDTKGGGGGLCNFSVEVHESGLVSLVRGDFRLASGDEQNLASASKDSPTSANTLWAVEAKEGASPLTVQLRQGALHFGPFLRKDRTDGIVLLGGQDGGHLRIFAANGAVDAKGGGGPQCQFRIITEGDCVRLQSIVEPHRYLGVSSWGALTGCALESSQQMFYLDTVCAEEPAQPPKLIGRAEFDECVDLTLEERTAFIRDGFIIIKNAVPPSLVDVALAQINAALLSPGSVIKDDDGALQVCPDARGSDAVQALLYATPLWTIAQRLLGRGRVAHCNASQMALRPPNLGAAPLTDESMNPKQWHIDGMGKGKHSPFSILLGIALSQQTRPNCGNLVAFPGSHHVLQPLLRREVEAGSGIFSDESGRSEGKPALAGGHQILLQPGDAVLLHQKVAHRVGVNLSPHIRYQTYFRLSHMDHAQKVEDGSLLDDLWVEFEGLKDDIANLGGEGISSEGPSAKARKMDSER